MSRLLLPPINRAMRTLDRAFFTKTIPISAARVFDPKNISRVSKECAKDMFRMKHIGPIVADPENVDKKVVMLRPGIQHDDLSTAGSNIQELVQSKIMELIPFSMQLKYEDWDYASILDAVLPEHLLGQVPVGYSQIGHIAHLNLRIPYAPYKRLIGEVLLDKNSPHTRTVVNKLDEVGTESVFRTFPMEIIAGAEETQVDLLHLGCRFTLDFAKVYWNTRLEAEHGRVVNLFKPGEAIADVMAGVGPFAVPTAKKGVLTWANDLNPDCYESLVRNAKRNKVSHLVSAHNEDGVSFIKNSIRELYKVSRSLASRTIPIPPTPAEIKKQRKLQIVQPEMKLATKEKYFSVPPTFSHFIMNLPATAVTFLGAFVGSFRGLEHLFQGVGARQLPMIHVYIFARPNDNPKADICARISKYLGYEMKEDVEIFCVRTVAPAKSYYCASFRLPAEVAFSESPPPANEDAEEQAKREEKEAIWLKWAKEN